MLEDHRDVDGATVPPDSSEETIRLITCVCRAQVFAVVLVELRVGLVCAVTTNRVDVDSGVYRVRVEMSTADLEQKPSEHVPGRPAGAASYFLLRRRRARASES